MTLKNLFLLFVFPLALYSEAKAFQSADTLKKNDLIWQNYDRYKEPAITHRLFKNSDILPLIQKHVSSGLFKDEIAGKSVQGRTIHHMTTGTGKIKVLLWSQMHGDEVSATMALFDLFNFLSADDEFNSFRQNLLSKLELHFVPMLNPDGAQIWTRRNAMNIDINRDAQNLATPEARLLMGLGKSLKPQFGFNLHDQSTMYAAGDTKEPATISFLAPAFNTAKDMNEVRDKAIKVIVAMNNALQTKDPGKVAKYNDTYDARCFGDQFTGMGISAILIESGGYPQDPEKQHIRKLNFYALITALDAIAQKSYEKGDAKNYWAIPNNNRNLYDVLVRNVTLPGETSASSLGILRHQQVDTLNYTSMNYIGTIAKVNDLEKAHGYEELDATGLVCVPIGRQTLSKDKAANLLLTKNGKPVYAIMNGYLVDLSKTIQ